jgi:hypothetical protein
MAEIETLTNQQIQLLYLLILLTVRDQANSQSLILILNGLLGKNSRYSEIHFSRLNVRMRIWLQRAEFGATDIPPVAGFTMPFSSAQYHWEL